MIFKNLFAFSISFLLLPNAFIIRPSCFLAASTDLGEKGHEVKPEKWWIIGAKPRIDFSKPGLALVNLVYTRKVHCLLEKYQVDKSKS